MLQNTAATVAAAAAALGLGVGGTVPAPIIKKAPSPCFTPLSMKHFQRRLINVVHPLTNANMISTTMTAEKGT